MYKNHPNFKGELLKTETYDLPSDSDRNFETTSTFILVSFLTRKNLFTEKSLKIWKHGFVPSKPQKRI